MKGGFSYLGSGRFLIFLLAIAIVVGMAFGLFAEKIGGTLLDMLSDPAANEARLATMSASQRSAHLWVTLTLDIVYPFAYGGGLANLAARFAPRNKLLAAAPGLALILVDLIENLLIVLMLQGDIQVIAVKSLVTQAKWWLFGGCSLLVTGLAVAAAIRHYASAGDSRVASRP